MQSIDGFKKFVKEYPNLYKKIPNNYIAIAKKGSHVNFNNYKKIMISSGLKIKETKEMNNHYISSRNSTIKNSIFSCNNECLSSFSSSIFQRF